MQTPLVTDKIFHDSLSHIAICPWLTFAPSVVVCRTHYTNQLQFWTSESRHIFQQQQQQYREEECIKNRMYSWGDLTAKATTSQVVLSCECCLVWNSAHGSVYCTLQGLVLHRLSLLSPADVSCIKALTCICFGDLSAGVSWHKSW